MATTIEQLMQAKATWEFKAPPFANGTELIVELRQPSLLTMLYDDGVVNPLLNDVGVLVEQSKNKKKGVKPSAEQTASAYRFVTKVVDYCMVSPTLKDVNEYAGGLSNEQLLAIYQEGLKSITDLSSFRPDTTDN